MDIPHVRGFVFGLQCAQKPNEIMPRHLYFDVTLFGHRSCRRAACDAVYASVVQLYLLSAGVEFPGTRILLCDFESTC